MSCSTKPGKKSKLNIQDANLLKVQVLYGYKLKVPFVNSVISVVGSWFTRDPLKLAYFSQRRIPILASSTVRMQSRAWDNDWILKRADIDRAASDAAQPGEPLQLADLERPWDSGPTGQGNPSDNGADDTAAGTPADDSSGNSDTEKRVEKVEGGRPRRAHAVDQPEPDESCRQPPGDNIWGRRVHQRPADPWAE